MSLKTTCLRVSFAACIVASPSYAQENSANASAEESNAPAASSEDASADAPPADDVAAQEPSADEAASPESTPTTPEVDPYAEAKERVGRAEILYADGNYDAALTEFERAFETMVGHPARGYVLFNVGKCQEKLYRYGDAIRSYRSYLDIAADDAEDRATVQAKIELLEGLLGTLNVSVVAKKGANPSSYEVWVDGRLVGENVKQLLVPGGNHQVEIRAEGFESENQEVQLPAKSEESLSFSLAPLAKEYKGLSPTYFWTSTGLAAATAVTGTAFGIVAVTQRKDVDEKPPEAVTEDDVKKIEQSALIADIFFISAGVFTTTSVILAFMTDWSGDTGESPESATRPGIKEVGFYPTRKGGVLSVGGSF